MTGCCCSEFGCEKPSRGESSACRAMAFWRAGSGALCFRLRSSRVSGRAAAVSVRRLNSTASSSTKAESASSPGGRRSASASREEGAETQQALPAEGSLKEALSRFRKAVAAASQRSGAFAWSTFEGWPPRSRLRVGDERSQVRNSSFRSRLWNSPARQAGDAERQGELLACCVRRQGRLSFVLGFAVRAFGARSFFV